MLDDPAIPGLIMFCCYDSRSMPLHMLSARRSVIKREARQPFWRSIDAFFSGAGQAGCLPPDCLPCRESCATFGAILEHKAVTACLLVLFGGSQDRKMECSPICSQISSLTMQLGTLHHTCRKNVGVIQCSVDGAYLGFALSR